MFARHNRMIGALYLLADLLLALLSFWVAYAVRARLVSLRPLYPVSFYPGLIPLAVGIWIGVGVAAGIYREIRE